MCSGDSLSSTLISLTFDSDENKAEVENKNSFTTLSFVRMRHKYIRPKLSGEIPSQSRLLLIIIPSLLLLLVKEECSKNGLKKAEYLLTAR